MTFAQGALHCGLRKEPARRLLEDGVGAGRQIALSGNALPLIQPVLARIANFPRIDHAKSAIAVLLHLLLPATNAIIRPDGSQS